ncbi:uncharacterized protein LOC106868425 [Octopus bimaculoides]|uniref:SOCS box domain-containing protein n=1 Tax=Octopus bimaculoides TaxID=37653 RepID=A0A0L8HV06_OCTBM|nr:uncharacterized protein LOC106868425 [Octopus bimaculoides]|eukprot:XP_014769155.1 PREDICTED: uncharacterized protein LOC106868425 [Octopus bimaculoides]
MAKVVPAPRIAKLVTEFVCEYSISDMTMTPDNHLCVAEEESCVSKYTLAGLCVGRLKLPDCYLGGVCCLQSAYGRQLSCLGKQWNDEAYIPGRLAVPTFFGKSAGRVLILDGSSGDEFGQIKAEVDTGDYTYWSVCDLGVDRGLVLARQGHVATTKQDSCVEVMFRNYRMGDIEKPIGFVWYISSISPDVIIVSDEDIRGLVMCTLQGEVITQYSDYGFNPSGLCPDPYRGCIYASNGEGNCVIRLTPDLEYDGEIVGAAQGLRNPFVVSLSYDGRFLVVAEDTWDIGEDLPTPIKVFSLPDKMMPLLYICRRNIRKLLGRTLLSAVPFLGLPKCLQNYLLYAV